MEQELDDGQFAAEKEVILQNWSNLISYPLFTFSSFSYLIPPFLLSAEFITASSLVLEQEFGLYNKDFSHTVSIAGLVGMKILLKSCQEGKMNAIAKSAFEKQSKMYYETIFGNLNSFLSEEVKSTFEETKSFKMKLDVNSIRRRIEHKWTYEKRVKELCSVLENVSQKHTNLNSAEIVRVIKQAFSTMTSKLRVE